MATVNGGVVSVDGSLTSLYINDELTIEGASFTSIVAAKSKGTVGVAAGTYTESRGSYGNLSLYGVEGAVVGGGSYTVASNTGDGGGLMKFTTGSALISGMTIQGNVLTSSDNFSRAGGGAILYNSSDGTLTVEGTLFTRNHSDSCSGALFLRLGNLIARDAVFSYNTAVGNGGAVRLNQAAEFYGATFAGNTSSSCGGAVSLNSGASSFVFAKDGERVTVFDRNVASMGGGLDVSAGGVELIDAVFTGNTAGDGGAVSFQKTAGLNSSLRNVAFVGNTATGNGGAIFVEGGSLGNQIYLSGLTFSGNTASGSGGALYMKGNADVRIAGLLTLETATDTIYIANGTLTVEAAEFLPGDTLFAKVIDTKFSGNYVFNKSIDVTAGYQLINSRNDLYVAPDGVVYDDGTVYVDTTAAAGMRATEISGQTVLNPLCSDAGEAFASGAENVVFAPGTFTLESRPVVSGRTISGATAGAVLGGGGVTASHVTVSGMTFSGNHLADGHGGALHLSGNNRISASVFSTNTIASSSASIYYGGAVYISGGTTTFEDTIFTGNAASSPCRGSAIYANGGTILLDRVHSLGNTVGVSFWFHNNSVVTIQDSTIEDTLLTRGALTVAGDVHFAGDINFYNGSITVNGNMIFDAGLTLAHWTNSFAFGTGGKLVFNNSSTVRFSVNGASEVMDLSNAAIEVDTAILPAGGVSYTIASGIAAMSDTVTVGGQTVTLGEAVEIDGEIYTFEHAANQFTVTRTAPKYDMVAVAPAGTESVVVLGTTIALDHRYDTLADAEASLEEGGTMILVGQSFAKGATVQTAAATLLVADSETSSSGGNVTIFANSDLVRNGNAKLTLDRFAVLGDKLFIGNAGTVNGDWEIALNALQAENIDRYRRGLVYLTGGSVTGAARIAIGNSVAASVFVLANETRVAGTVGLTVTGSACDSISLSASSAEGKSCGGVDYSIADTFVNGNVQGGGNSKTPVIDGNIAIRLTGSTVTGALYGSYGNQVAADKSIAVTLSGSTVGAVNRSGVWGTVRAPLTVTVTGATASVIGSLSDVANLVIDAGATAEFAAAQDFSAVKLITVDASNYAGADLVVATGVAAVGDYAVTGNPTSDSLALLVRNGDLILTRATEFSGEETGIYTGGTATIMTGGFIGKSFVGTDNTTGSVASVIRGGTVVNPVIGGALQRQNQAKTVLDTVTLTISGGEIAGGADNGGQLYTAGYAYGAGDAAVDTAVTYEVGTAALVLSGGSIAAQNLFAGVHARKGAWTVANETVVTVTAGAYHRIYGGGWAELNGKSEVGAATISVSGGTVERIYAGGANAAGGETVTGSATITVSGDAAVDFIFLAGKNANCSVTNDAAVTLSGDAKSLVRISGRNGNGSDKTGGVTSLTVATNTTVDYLDYVDVLNLAQGSTLDITTLAQYENGSDATLNFLTDGGSEAWTALSGAGFELFQSAQFQVNGETVLRDGETGALGESGYKLDFTDDKFIITKLA